MLIYLKVNVVEKEETYVGYSAVELSPAYLWRYSRPLFKDQNFMKKHIYRSLMRNSGNIYELGIF